MMSFFFGPLKIYTFWFAWQEIRQKLNQNLSFKEQNPDSFRVSDLSTVV